MRIIVLGASGQIGQRLMVALAKGLPSAQIVGCSRKVTVGQPENLEWIEFDPFFSPWHILGKVDVLINCIGQVEDRGEDSFERVHMGVTTLILAHREMLGNPRVIQLSALGANEDDTIPFLQTKGRADNYLSGEPDAFVLRPSIVCTESTMLIRRLHLICSIARKMGGVFIVPEQFWDTTIQPIMGSDLCQIILRLCQDGVSVPVVEIVGPDRIMFRQLIHMASSKYRMNAKLWKVPARVADLVIGKYMTRFFPQLLSPQQYEALKRDNTGDVIMTRQVLGEMPASTLPFWQREL